jgi:hypothetical protein
LFNINLAETLMNKITPIAIVASFLLVLTPGLNAQQLDAAAPTEPTADAQAMNDMPQQYRCNMQKGGRMGMGGPMMDPEMRQHMMHRRQQMMGQGQMDPQMHQQHHRMMPQMMQRRQGMMQGGEYSGKAAMKQAMRQLRMEHMQMMEHRLANIEALLQELVEQNRQKSQPE